MKNNILSGCQNGEHLLQTIFTVDIDGFEERQVYWCEICGCIQVFQTWDGRNPKKLSPIRTPKVAREYWDLVQ